MADAPNPPASRWPTIAGMLGAVLMLLSAPAHSLLGWPDVFIVPGALVLLGVLA